MKVLSLFTATALLSAVGLSSAAEKTDYVYGKDPKKDAEYDISMGMAGIQQAAKDPKLLAQLFQDMQVCFDPKDATYDVPFPCLFQMAVSVPSYLH